MSDILQQHTPKEWEELIYARPRFWLPAQGIEIKMPDKPRQERGRLSRKSKRRRNKRRKKK
jgi:hypothetical protein